MALGGEVNALLQLERVEKSFGSVRVIRELSIRVEAGEALGVVGPNGAGKTTMMDLISGTVPLDAGVIRFDGSDISRIPAHARCRAGIARTHQVPQPFEGLTVGENVLVGLRFGRAVVAEAPYETTRSLLERVGLASKINTPAAALTLLERKHLELARALATDPRLLLLDEIGGGLTEAEVERLVGTIHAIRSEGLTIVWIEHIVHALVSVVDRLMAMDFGQVLVEGPPDEVMASAAVRAVYMGVGDE